MKSTKSLRSSEIITDSDINLTPLVSAAGSGNDILSGFCKFRQREVKEKKSGRNIIVGNDTLIFKNNNLERRKC